MTEEPIVSAKGSNGTVYQSGVVFMRTSDSSSTGIFGDGYLERLQHKPSHICQKAYASKNLKLEQKYNACTEAC